MIYCPAVGVDLLHPDARHRLVSTNSHLTKLQTSFLMTVMKVI